MKRSNPNFEMERKKEGQYIDTAILQPEFAEELDNLKSGISILDLGCLHGHYWFDLYEQIKFNSIVGVDLRPLEELNEVNTFENFKERNSNSSFTQEDFNKTFGWIPKTNVFDFINDYKGESFDLIILSTFIHHLPYEAQPKLLEQIKPLVNYNGYVYIRANDQSSFTGEKPAYNSYQFEKMLEPEFEIIVTSHDYHVFDILAKKKL